MIQILTKSFDIYRRNKNRIILSATVIIILFLIILFAKNHFTENEKINSVLNNILQFSGIYSAILITFIISKIFQIRQEKLKRLQEIIVLSNKTTDFRRICEIIVETDDFWKPEMRHKMDGQFKDLSYFHLHIDNENRSEKLKEFITEFYETKEKPGADFYLGVKSLIQNGNKRFHLELFDDYDYNIIYSFHLISKWVGVQSANTFWYYLEYKWHTYKSIFNISAISKFDISRIISLAKKIDNKEHLVENFDKDTLVNLGNYLNSFVLPRLYQLTYENEQKIGKTLNLVITNLVAVMIFGIFLPIIVTSINIKIDYLILTAYFSIILLSLSVLYFVYYFKIFLVNEITIGTKNK